MRTFVPFKLLSRVLNIWNICNISNINYLSWSSQMEKCLCTQQETKLHYGGFSSSCYLTQHTLSDCDHRNVMERDPLFSVLWFMRFVGVPASFPLLCVVGICPSGLWFTWFIILNGCKVWANLLNCLKIHFDGVDYWM